MTKFDVWFDDLYPVDAFGTQPGVMRSVFKEVARKAWDAGYENGYDQAAAESCGQG